MGDMANVQSGDGNNSQVVDISGKIMVAAIIVLFLVIVFVLFLHLYARWFWNRRADGRSYHPSRPRRRFVFVPAQESVIHNGLEPCVINSIPLVVFNSVDFEQGLECAVCLSEVTNGEKARLLPICNHGFHVDCIDMWFQSHSTCPLCRNTVSVDSTKCSPTQEGIQSPHPPPPPQENFPTNVLFWGNHTQVTTGASNLEQVPTSSSSSTSSNTSPNLVIDIPRQQSTFEEMKSPMAVSPLKSFRRLLSKEKRVINNPSSPDMEQGQEGRGHSSKTSSDSFS